MRLPAHQAGNLSAPFVRRPVATVLIMTAVLLLGLVAYIGMPIAALPAVERPTIEVYAPLPGASPGTVASALAQPLEHQLGLIPGIVEMSSYGGTGGVDIVIQFELAKSLDDAAQAVQAAINAAGPNLPKDQAWPPSYWKSNPSGFSAIALALTSDIVPPSQLYEYADSVLSPKISQLPGVARVSISGAERKAVRVQVSPGRIAQMNLSLEAIRTAIVAASQNLPKGAIDIQGQNLVIDANDQILAADEYREITVAWRNGAPVRLGDVALVTDSVINNKLDGWYGTGRGVVLYVYKQPDANVVETVDAVKAMLPEVERWLPPSVKVHSVYDRTLLIRASIADVQLTIGIAILLVVLVVALFLKHFWATLIPGLTIPVALAATLAVMRVNGYSLDNLTLMALTIAVGFVVDDAVIVIENIMRRIDAGETPMQASLNGTRQMGFTILSITVALAAALIPILFMPDIVGRYFREFGITLVAAIGASAFVSLTLTPMLCSRLLKREDVQTERARGRIAGRLSGFYAASLDWALSHRGLVLAAALGITAATAGLYLVLPKGFMPTQDTGVMFVRTIADANISFAAMEDRQRAVGETILGDPAVSGFTSYIGEGNGSALSNGQLIVALKPPDVRKLSIQQVIARLRTKLAALDGIRAYFTPMQDLNFGAQSSTSRYQYTLWGIDMEQVILAAATMRTRIRALPQVTDVIANWETNGLQAGLTIDRTRAAALGVTPLAIDNTLDDAFGQRQIKTLYLPTNYSRVILEVDPAAQGDPSVFGRLYVPGSGKGQVPLAALTRPSRSHAVMWVHHSAQFPSATVSFDVKPGSTITDAIAAVRAAETAAHLPDEVKAEFRGEAAEAAKTGGTQLLLFGAAILAVYIVLGMLYESYVHPFTILSTLPSTVFGALLALWVTGTQFTLVTSIACILLVGMVMKNAIMMVDFALEAERRDGLSPQAAIRQAALARVRPITMTMLVAVLSAVPIAVGTGPGYELRQPLGIAIVGGLLVAQLFTLYTTPVVYLLTARLSRLTAGKPELFLLPGE
ncbi:MAG TPA: efflux RND transporter permease subunit [Aliidongia sp.]|uniref:efflux RND transporter permease subunit n=1 Tax=Aliidongia sp. TaxID=1914230 RepID=UPI002DDCA351|nr:efflux RND transporter permease subunit [Aliidongia sp.]HEV2673321.1 efflux RND transporter permease subunit [Aliidongia sp.]